MLRIRLAALALFLVAGAGSLLPTGLAAQAPLFQPVTRTAGDSSALSELRAFQLLRCDPAALARLVDGTGPLQARWEIDERVVVLDLHRPNRPAPAVPITRLRPEGALRDSLGPAHQFRGNIRTAGAQGEAWLMVREGQLSAGWALHDTLWILEPLRWHWPQADADLLVLYRAPDARPAFEGRCGSPHPEGPAGLAPPRDAPPEEATADRSTGCKEVEYQVAADWLFTNKYGGVSGAILRMETIMALVEWQYSGAFQNEYLFQITGYLISDCAGCDPPEWTNTTNAGTLLTLFRSWAENDGFGFSGYDIAGLWTGRTFDVNIIGVAYIEGVCNDARYQALSDFSASSSLMRVMVSHEFGHNFSSLHDSGSGFIMSPTVGETTQWSGQSKTAINAYTQTRQCLANCTLNPPPVADFSASPRTGCAPLSVAYTDLSSNDPTGWNWQLPGAVPVQSADQHPQVTYPLYGRWLAALTVQNPYGSNTYTRFDYIEVEDVPAPDFEHIVDGRKVFFINTTERATVYHWDFGDGQTSSAESPEHTYGADGTYIITLTTGNSCGQAATTRVITIWTTPLAQFGADTLSGCAPLTVAFEDLSSPNVTEWRWRFQGGQPDSSALRHPQVSYAVPGLYPVTLTVRNPAGADTLTRTAYIEVRPLPDTVFHTHWQGDTLFVSWSGIADSIRWTFGDGTFSTTADTFHRYLQEGVYTLGLDIFSPCGLFHLEREVSLIRAPEAGFEAHPLLGCLPLSVTFRDQSQGQGLTREWFFPGGIPATATDSVVEVLYPQAGVYTAGLAVANTAGMDTLWKWASITVEAPLTADFTQDIDGLQVTLESLCPQASLHEWQTGDGQSAEGPLVVHLYPAAGLWTVRYTATNSCGPDSIHRDVLLLPTAIRSPSGAPAWRVWPQPAGTYLYLERFGLAEDRTSILLLDLQGRPVLQADMPGDWTGPYPLALEGFPAGTYILLISEAGRQQVLLVLKG